GANSKHHNGHEKRRAIRVALRAEHSRRCPCVGPGLCAGERSAAMAGIYDGVDEGYCRPACAAVNVRLERGPADYSIGAGGWGARGPPPQISPTRPRLL